MEQWFGQARKRRGVVKVLGLYKEKKRAVRGSVPRKLVCQVALALL